MHCFFAFLIFQLDGMILEDHVVVQPCLTVLQRLNAQVYSGLRSEMQVNLVKSTVFTNELLLENDKMMCGTMA